MRTESYRMRKENYRVRTEEYRMRTVDYRMMTEVTNTYTHADWLVSRVDQTANDIIDFWKTTSGSVLLVPAALFLLHAV